MSYSGSITLLSDPKLTSQQQGRVFGGVVEHGDKRGRLLGFPTANLSVSEDVDCVHGVYASITTMRDGSELREYPSVSSLGFRPTFSGTSLRLETHIFDFDQDIYGHDISVDLLYFLRGERKFESMEELSSAITIDKAEAQILLAVINNHHNKEA